MDVAVTSAFADVAITTNDSISSHTLIENVSTFTPNGNVYPTTEQPSLLDLSNDEMEEPRPIRPTSLCVASSLSESPPALNGELINFNHVTNETSTTMNPVPQATEVLASTEPILYTENYATDGYAIASPSEHDQMIEHIVDGDDLMMALGSYKPFWIPDTDADSCMICDLRFNVIKRRHHCRACGKVLCASCCGMRAKLQYLENKEARFVITFF